MLRIKIIGIQRNVCRYLLAGFFSNAMKHLITQQIFFFRTKKQNVLFFFLFYLSAFVYNRTKISHKHKDLFPFWVDGGGFTYKQKGSRFDTRLRQFIVYVVQLG